MKKMIAVLLAASCLLLSGCSYIPDAYGGPKQSQAEQHSSDACLEPATFQDYDEYTQWIKSVKWPYGFAAWSDVNYLGTWEKFVISALNGSRDKYRYVFTDSSGAEFWLCVDHTINTVFPSYHALIQEATVLTVSGDMTSMRQNADPNPELYRYSVIDRDGVQYFYKGGKLLVIRWVLNGVEYILDGGDDLSLYPVERNDTFVGRLLSVDDTDFKQALAEIKPDAVN